MALLTPCYGEGKYTAGALPLTFTQIKPSVVTLLCTIILIVAVNCMALFFIIQSICHK